MMRLLRFFDKDLIKDQQAAENEVMILNNHKNVFEFT